MVTIEKEYQLGSNSLPHVTLSQLTLEEVQVDEIWKSIYDAIENSKIFLSFNSFSCITFDDKVFWISLIPQETPGLQMLNKEINSILNLSNNRPYDSSFNIVKHN